MLPARSYGAQRKHTIAQVQGVKRRFVVLRYYVARAPTQALARYACSFLYPSFPMRLRRNGGYEKLSALCALSKACGRSGET